MRLCGKSKKKCIFVVVVAVDVLLFIYFYLFFFGGGVPNQNVYYKIYFPFAIFTVDDVGGPNRKINAHNEHNPGFFCLNY